MKEIQFAREGVGALVSLLIPIYGHVGPPGSWVPAWAHPAPSTTDLSYGQNNYGRRFGGLQLCFVLGRRDEEVLTRSGKTLQSLI